MTFLKWNMIKKLIFLFDKLQSRYYFSNNLLKMCCTFGKVGGVSIFFLFLALCICILTVDIELYNKHRKEIKEDNTMFAGVIYSCVISVLGILISGTVCKAVHDYDTGDSTSNQMILFVFAVFHYIGVIIVFFRFKKFWDLGSIGIAYLVFNNLITSGMIGLIIVGYILFLIGYQCFNSYRNLQ